VCAFWTQPPEGAVVRRIALLVTVLLIAAACTSTVTGSGTVGGGLGSPNSSARTVTPPVSSGPSSPDTSGPSGVTHSLVGQLIEPPPGAHPWHSGWAHNRTPSVRQFVAHVYPHDYVDAQVSLLNAEGIRRVAHETWYAPDADQADVVLLEFDNEGGAHARYLAATYAKRQTAGIKKFVVPGSPRAVGYYHAELDRLGNVAAIVYGQVHNVVVEEFYFSPARIRTTDAIAWMHEQLAALK